VQKHFISKVTPKEVMINDMLLPIGRSYKETVEKLVIEKS
jgi:hypothetical protein